MSAESLFGMRVIVNPALPDDTVVMFATCPSCGHATALHLGADGCTECLAHDWPADLVCRLERPEGGAPFVVVQNIDKLREAADG